MKRALIVVSLVIAALIALAVIRGQTPASESERNRAFQDAMAGVTLIGNSTRLNREGLSREERYVIDGISHLSGDMWLFRTRLQHGGREIPVPIPLKVLWAGDTPVITLTDLSIPGIGTYTARVMLYRDQYAGTWSAKSAGGQLFGRIVRGSNP